MGDVSALNMSTFATIQDPDLLDAHLAELATFLRHSIDDPGLLQHHRLDLIRAYGSPLTPEQSMAAKQIAAWHLLLKSIWLRINADFTVEGIPVVLLKGIYWSESLYPQSFLRTTGDLDILVPKQKVEAARALLLAMGCEPVASPYMTDDTMAVRHFHWGFSYPVGSRSVTVELHWQLARPGEFALSTETIWRYVVKTSDGWRLNPELDLLFACLHAHRHGLDLFRYLIDVARVLVFWQGEIDWNAFWRLTQDAGVEGIAAVMLLLSSRYVGAPLPPEQFRHVLRNPLVRLAAWPFTLPVLFGPSKRPKARRLWLTLATCSWASAVDALREIFAPPPELVAAEYQVTRTKPLDLALAYTLRPLRLILKYWNR